MKILLLITLFLFLSPNALWAPVVNTPGGPVWVADSDPKATTQMLLEAAKIKLKQQELENQRKMMDRHLQLQESRRKELSSPRHSEEPKQKSFIDHLVDATSEQQYKVLYATFVYDEARNDGIKVLRLAEGTKVNVVEDQGDWLKIRSKHGRPDGFIRKEDTVPIVSGDY